MDTGLNKPGPTIHTLDLHFQDTPGAIASYMIPHKQGVILIESGPGTTIPALEAGLVAHGFKVGDVTDVLLTHIHLDHAGAAGWLARQGARIYVHPAGAPHMIDPERLLASARRLYGEAMDSLWGEFLPVPEERLSIPKDGDVIEIEGLRFRALDTPGHAYHHYVYLFQGVCFSGDIGGVRMGGIRHIRLPMPPPEFHLEFWRESLKRLRDEHIQGSFTRIAPTHFGIYDDPDWHLTAMKRALDEIEYWILQAMASDPTADELREKFVNWARERSLRMGVDPDLLTEYEVANPSWMSAYGIHRYWNKVRQPS